MIVADRYAKALMELARESGKVEEVRKDMKMLLEVRKSSREFELLLKSPVIKTDKKISVLTELFNGKVTKLSLSFITLITSKHREGLLGEIAEAFDELYKKDKNILTAIVTSAYGLDDKTRTKMLELVKSQTKGEVELVEKVDKDTIGGFILRIGDRQVDRSVARQLSTMKNKLVNKELN